MGKKNSHVLNKIKFPLLAAALFLACAAGLRAADKAYLITELRPAGKGLELVLRDVVSLKRNHAW